MRPLIILFLLICLAGNNLIFAQWDKYPTYDEYISIMNKFETDYPNLCKIEEIGESVQGRKLLFAKLSDNVAEDEAEPGVFYMSTIDGDETGGYVLMLHLIDYLLSNYVTDNLVTKLVDSVEIWINPLANPDGTYYGGDSTVQGARRYNANGVDLHFNFPCPDGSNQGIIQKETQAIIDFCNERHFVISADFNAGAEIILYPWGYTYTSVADIDWFKYICKNWADLAQANSPSGYFTDHDVGYANYREAVPSITPPKGTFIDYMLFFQHCRDVKVEISYEKILQESQLLDHWNFQKESMLSYIEQALYGVRGIVTDSAFGWPLEVKVFVENHDYDSSWVYSHLPHGDYYRPLYTGTYDITFSYENYVSKTIPNVVVYKNQTTILDVKLSENINISYVHKNKNSLFTVCVKPSSKIATISFVLTNKGNTKLQIYNINGRVISTLVDSYKKAGEYTVNWDSKRFGSGVYFLKLSAKGSAVSRKVTVIR